MKWDIHSLLSARYAKWIIISLSALFSLLIVAEWATLFLSSPQTAIATADTGVARSAHRAENYQYILDTALFGVYVPNDLNDSQIKKSLLQVTLVGIILASGAEESQVIIRAAGGSEKIYKAGDKLPGGAVIKRIMADGVLVERDGELERLSLPGNELIFEPMTKPQFDSKE